ncbi:hypothetical protein BDA96_06G023900 [Sorghum bicolor]|uniref:Uncharacterized protein n=1 Tax=Sorghum bicolor TaxID=4558 RepID=A0A921UAQ1_SORBI|nr:hypothetical protein BDA96_06G023900 [Sorghum bicolor]
MIDKNSVGEATKEKLLASYQQQESPASVMMGTLMSSKWRKTWMVMGIRKRKRLRRSV